MFCVLEVKAGWLIPFVDKRVACSYKCVSPLTHVTLSAPSDASHN